MITVTHGRSEAGESLVELLVTIAIISIAVVGLVGAMADGITASNSHRQHATAGTVALNVAEAIKDRKQPNLPNFFDPTGNYTWPGVTVPSGYKVTVIPTCWNRTVPPINTASFVLNDAAHPCTSGLQRIAVTAASTAKGEKETVTIFKRQS